MQKISGTSFRSDYGFSSPNFAVDSDGNLTATSITTVADTDSSAFNFTITDDANGEFFVEPLEGVLPSFEINKTQSVLIGIELDLKALFFLREDKQTFFTSGLQHSTGLSGADAQGQSNGNYRINIPANYDQDIIYYTDRERNFFGEISVSDPTGIFSQLDVTSTLDSASPETGALRVVGGVGIAKSLSVGSILSTPILETNNIVSDTDISFSAAGTISILANDSSLLGEINDQGSTIPVLDTTIINSAINNSSIGIDTPAEAEFTNARVNFPPAANNDITNKAYVDTRDIAFSIAFGL